MSQDHFDDPDHLALPAADPSLQTEDLAPLPVAGRRWGWFEFFSVWSNDIRSLFGDTLAETLFRSSGLNGWSVFAAIVLAGAVIGIVGTLVADSLQ